MKISANPLPNPPDGYEWRMQPQVLNRESITFVLCPIRKQYDWSKTGLTTMVELEGEFCTYKLNAMKPFELVTDIWQAHIGGDPCPVDPDATMVRYRRNGETFGPAKAGNIGWDVDTLFEVTGLVEGYSYD